MVFGRAWSGIAGNEESNWDSALSRSPDSPISGNLSLVRNCESESMCGCLWTVVVPDSKSSSEGKSDIMGMMMVVVVLVMRYLSE